MKLRNYIGDKAFYKMTLTVAIPIIIQNFITNFVSMLDNVMVGSLGTEEMSGVSIVNQLVFIFSLAVFGALSGAGIFTAQYYGKNDEDGIRYTLRYKSICAVLIFVISIAVFIFLDTPLIDLFLHEGDLSCDISLTRSLAKEYLRVILWGILPFCISQVFSSSLRETGETVAPMVAGFVAVLTNCLFNYLLIFGKFGFPKLGVTGAAIATDISRYVECLLIIIYSFRKRSRFRYFEHAFSSMYIPKDIAKIITVKGMPLLINEFLWSSGMSLLSVSYSLHGISVVAGYSISSTVMNLASIAFLALGSSIGIIIGKYLGANRFDEAIDVNRKLIAFSLAMSVVLAVFVFMFGGLIPGIYNTTAESKEYASYFIKVCAIFMPFRALSNASYFTVRSGGKTMITFFMDSVYVFCIPVAAAFTLFYVFRLSIWVIFPIVESLEIVKSSLGMYLVRKRIWLNNIAV